MRKATKAAAAWLGVVAGIAGLEHGYFAFIQGNAPTPGLAFPSWGPPCVPEEIWRACEPAMSMIPNFLITGILGMLSLLALLVGGGFVPVSIGMVAALWLPGSWLLGYFFGPAMLSVGGLLFLVFDIGLPMLAAVAGTTHTQR